MLCLKAILDNSRLAFERSIVSSNSEDCLFNSSSINNSAASSESTFNIMSLYQSLNQSDKYIFESITSLKVSISIIFSFANRCRSAKIFTHSRLNKICVLLSLYCVSSGKDIDCSRILQV